jgi:mannosyltransferase
MSLRPGAHPKKVDYVPSTSHAVADASLEGLRAKGNAGALERLRTSVLVRDVALVSAVSLVLGLIRLGSPSFWVDEAFTAAEMKYSLVDKLDVQYHFLYLVLIEPWAALVGSSEWALRVPSVLGAMLAVGLTVVVANRLFERRVALVSGLLLATSPFFVKWSQQARPYTMFVALCLLAVLLLLRALERGSRGAWATFGVALSAVMVWQPAAALLMLPAYAVLLVQRRDRFLPHGLLAAVIVAAVGFPWAAITAMRSTGEGVNINWLQFPTAEIATRALFDVSGAAGLGVLLACVGLWVLRRTGRSELSVWLGAWALCPFALGLVVSTLKPIYLDRFLSGAAPAFAMLAAVALLGVRTKLRWIGAAAVVVATAIGLPQWYAPKDGGNWRGEDWRSATRTVLELRKPGDDLVVAPWWAYRGAEYYGARPNDVSLADSIWVLNWSEAGHELPADERAGLGFGQHVLVEEREFGWRLSAQLWKRPGTP